MTAPTLRETIYLPPDDIIRAWEARGTLMTTTAWSEMMHGEHAGGFTVAKVAKLELLGIIRASLDEVIRNGGTLEQWQADLIPNLQKHGWWGVVTDPEITGTSEPVIINKRRLQTIYRTNVRMSFAAGEWRKIQSKKHLLPYLRYKSDHYRKHPRLNHQSWHGLILPVDDPTWQWLYPPNGWGCNCLVQQLSETNIKMNGWTVGTAPNPPLGAFVTATGETVMVPEGISPGFSYNPGTAHLQVIAEKAGSTIAAALQKGLITPARETLRAIIDDPAFEQFLALPDGLFPVGILDEAQAATIGAREQMIMFKPYVKFKQDVSHPDLDISDYRLLPDLIANAEHVIVQNDITIVYITDRNEGTAKIWKAVIRNDKRDKYPLLMSYQRSGLGELRREQARAKSIIAQPGQ